MTTATDQWQQTAAYLCDLFGRAPEDAVQKTLEAQPKAAADAGLPAIAISADVGRLLSILTRLATRCAESTGRVVEVGTLGGYSGIWIARALPPGARLITLERDPKHAAFAATQFESAGLADRVEIIHGPALERLPALVDSLGPAGLDMVFLDADKRE